MVEAHSLNHWTTGEVLGFKQVYEKVIVQKSDIFYIFETSLMPSVIGNRLILITGVMQHVMQTLKNSTFVRV